MVGAQMAYFQQGVARLMPINMNNGQVPVQDHFHHSVVIILNLHVRGRVRA